MKEGGPAPLLTRRQFVRDVVFGGGGLALLSGCAGVGPALKTAAEDAAGYAGIKLIENQAEHFLQGRYRDKTRQANQNIRLNLSHRADLRYSIRLDEAGGFGFFGVDEDLVSGLIDYHLSQTLGGIMVAPLVEVRRETEERGFLRGNEDVDQATVSPKGTIIREGAGGFTVVAKLQFLQAAQTLGGSDLRTLEDLFQSAGLSFDIGWVKTVAVGSLRFQDKDKLINLGMVRAWGVATEVTDFSLELFSKRREIRIQRRQNQTEEKQLAALDSLLQNAMAVIQEKVR